MKERRIDWVALLVVAVGLALCLLSSCKTRKESVNDYKLDSTVSADEHLHESRRELIEAYDHDERDSLEASSWLAGKIEISRDSLGNPVTINYFQTFTGQQTQRTLREESGTTLSAKSDKDSAINQSANLNLTGRTKEKKNTGISQWELFLFMGGFLLMIALMLLVFILVLSKRIKKLGWKE